jgi:hypothetical protein
MVRRFGLGQQISPFLNVSHCFSRWFLPIVLLSADQNHNSVLLGRIVSCWQFQPIDPMPTRCYLKQRFQVTMLLFVLLLCACAPSKEKPKPVELPKDHALVFCAQINMMFPGAGHLN